MSILDTVKGVFRSDAWLNTMTAVGLKARGMRLYQTSPLDPEYLDRWYGQDDMARRVVEAPVEHALMLGIDVANDEDELARAAISDWGLVEILSDAAIYGRLFGGAGIFVGISGADHSKPLEDVAAGSLEFLQVVDRRDMSILDDESYRVSRNGESFIEVHESRIILFEGLRTTDRARIKNGGWSHSVLRPVYDAIRDFHSNWAATTELFQGLTQPVYGIKNLAALMKAGKRDALADRLGLIEAQRSMSRAVMVDADEESFTQVGAKGVNGVSGLLDNTYQRVASAAQMPVTILMGMSPSGLNATGESDMRSWFNTVQVYREQKLGPRAKRLLEIVFQSEGISVEDLRIVWPSLWQMAPTEEAEYEKTVTETDVLRIVNGLMSEEQIAEATWGGGKFSADRGGVYEGEAPEPLDVPEGEIATAMQPKEEEPAKEGLNGAQIKSMVEVATLVSTGDLERGSALGILSASFPALTREQVTAILPPEGFDPKAPATPEGDDDAEDESTETEETDEA